MNKFGYSSIYLFPVLAVLGYYLGGWYTFLPLLVAYIGFPLLDTIFGTTDKNPSAEQEAELKQASFYRYLTYPTGPIMIAIVIWGCWVVANESLAWNEYLGLLLSTGLVTGAVGITVAHEQCHKIHNPLEIQLARMSLLSSLYMHFRIEHVYGHHARVATPADPATARLGQSLYRFILQSVWGGYKSAWRIEHERLRKRKHSFWSRHNQMLTDLIIQLGFMALIAYSFGLAGWLFFVLQAIIGFGHLEVINYIEHYGLQRRQLANGRYEKVKQFHSWNSDHIASNYVLFGLPRHSDHHAHATRCYQILRSLPGSPQLPHGYPAMVLLAFFPNLWRRIMDPRVMEARRTLANMASEAS